MWQELVLIRSNSDTSAIISSTENKSVKVVLNKILWKMPHISVSDGKRLKLVGYVARNMELDAAFRDCSHQNESLKSGSVEIRLKFETNKDISPNTSCYVLILHD
ncbi:hypothetical protein NQ315_006049 [Exocentrus adspersus]|uniref:Double jelly roll-like domain-containing protein n=1 Tax=Exocentrus adspersus TaxID=1586481 RepID=A0AAV8VGT1_9CUCU|nr:hypothetical protein NQ315_006049 [Exocentrus adspersus]